jgi:hypothetical protein
MDEPEELSDAEFMDWAGTLPERWALLSNEKREAWLDHLVARIKSTDDEQESNACWRLAYIIARADSHSMLEELHQLSEHSAAPGF